MYSRRSEFSRFTDLGFAQVHFNAVRLKIRHMEIDILRQESVGGATPAFKRGSDSASNITDANLTGAHLTGSNLTVENCIVTKFEIMDGTPARGQLPAFAVIFASQMKLFLFECFSEDFISHQLMKTSKINSRFDISSVWLSTTKMTEGNGRTRTFIGVFRYFKKQEIFLLRDKETKHFAEQAFATI